MASILGDIMVDNKSSIFHLTISKLTLTDMQIKEPGFIADIASFPIELKGPSSIKLFYQIDGGLFSSTSASLAELNFTLKRIDGKGKSVTGELRIYPSGGEHYPDFMNIEINYLAPDGKRKPQNAFQMELSTLDQLGDFFSSVGGVAKAAPVYLLVSNTGITFKRGNDLITLEDIAGLAIDLAKK